MGIRNAQQLEHTLDAAILTETAVECIEDAIDFGVEKLARDVLAGIDLHDVEPFLAQRFGTARARRQADLTLGRAASQQHGDAFERHVTPTRLISHSSVTPDFALTRARTSSPSASISAAVASP